MTKNPSRKKIKLNRETMRHLTADSLRGVAGGMINLSRPSQCPDCPSDNGCP